VSRWGRLIFHVTGRLIFHVTDVDAFWTNLKEKGFDPEIPRDASWGERYFHMLDPDGHELSFARRCDEVAKKKCPERCVRRSAARPLGCVWNTGHLGVSRSAGIPVSFCCGENIESQRATLCLGTQFEAGDRS
jgi:hypothetical protein